MDAPRERMICCSGTVRPLLRRRAPSARRAANSRAWSSRAKGQVQMPANRLHRREQLRHWKKAREYRERAIGYLELARLTPNLDAQNRFIKIAQHYRTLANAEERDAKAKASSGDQGLLTKFSCAGHRSEHCATARARAPAARVTLTSVPDSNADRLMLQSICYDRTQPLTSDIIRHNAIIGFAPVGIGQTFVTDL